MQSSLFENKSIYLFSIQYQSYISNWYINGQVFTSSYYTMETPKFEFSSKKFKIWILTYDEELKSP